MAELGFEDCFQTNPEVLSYDDAAKVLKCSWEMLQAILDGYDNGTRGFEATRFELARLKGFIALKTSVRMPAFPEVYSQGFVNLYAETCDYMQTFYEQSSNGDND